MAKKRRGTGRQKRQAQRKEIMAMLDVLEWVLERLRELLGDT